MSVESLQSIIGMAIVDRAFCTGLLSSPGGMIAEFDLSDEERLVVSSIKAKNLAQFAARVDMWLAKLPARRSAQRAAPHWTADLLRIAG